MWGCSVGNGRAAGISRCTRAIYIINPPHQRCYEQRMPKNKRNIAFARGTFCLKYCVFSMFSKSRLHFGRLFGQHPCPGRRCPKAILKCQGCHDNGQCGAFPSLLLNSNRIIKWENEFGTNLSQWWDMLQFWIPPFPGQSMVPVQNEWRIWDFTVADNKENVDAGCPRTSNRLRRVHRKGDVKNEHGRD